MLLFVAVGWLLACLVGWLLGCLPACVLGWLLAWLLARLLACLHACWLAWLVGWLVGCCWMFLSFLLLPKGFHTSTSLNDPHQTEKPLQLQVTCRWMRLAWGLQAPKCSSGSRAWEFWRPKCCHLPRTWGGRWVEEGMFLELQLESCQLLCFFFFWGGGSFGERCCF